MANFTPNYNLKKPLENENYSVNDQNGNMDIIDTKLKEVSTKVDNIVVPDGTTSQKGIVQLNNSTTSTSTTQAATANAVKLTMDRANQAFQSASDGKNYIAGKVGNVTGSSTFIQIGDEIQVEKNTISSNLNSKGVSASNNETLRSLAGKIDNISISGLGGKFYKEGIINHISGKRDEIKLDFQAGFLKVDQPGGDYYKDKPYICIPKISNNFYIFKSENSPSGIYYDNTTKIFSISSSVSNDSYKYYIWGE